MKPHNLVFDTFERPELAEAIVFRLDRMNLFCRKSADLVQSIWVGDSDFEESEHRFCGSDLYPNYRLATLSDLYDTDRTHSVVLDGTEVEVTHEVYERVQGVIE